MSNITLLGDSHLARLISPKEKVIKSYFNKLAPNLFVQNLTSGGADTNDGLKVIQSEKIIRHSTVFVSFGTNDSASWKEVPLVIYRKNYLKIITILKQYEYECKIVLISPPPVNEKKQIPPGRSNKVLARYASTVRKIAVENETRLIDLFSIISEKMSSADTHLADGVHLNNNGCSTLIKMMKQFVK